MNPSSEVTLESLIAQLAAGDEAAAAAIYDRMAPRVYGLACSFLGAQEAAEEATVDVFAEVWRKASRFDPDRGAGATWILAVARSALLDRLRVRQRERRRRDEFSGVEERIESAEAGPADREQALDDRRFLRRALEALPSAQRQALEVAFFGGVSYREAAEVLGLPEGTVKARIRSALLRLRQVAASLGGGVES